MKRALSQASAKRSESVDDGASIDLGAPEEEIRAYFQRTAKPSQRIELWLEQMERDAAAIQSEFDKTLEVRQRKADRAAALYKTLQSNRSSQSSEKESKQLAKAAQAFCDAQNAVRPPVWSAAREVLINTGLVRADLARGAGDEAIEAALRAVNAWWRMRTLQFEKSIRYGFEGWKARSEGGKKRAAHAARSKAGRDAKIRMTFKNILAAGTHSHADAIKALSASWKLTTKQIRRIVSSRDIC